MVTKDKAVIFIDGQCLLCNAFVKFILKHDRKDQFVFTHLQSNGANQNKPYLNTVVLEYQGHRYYKSDVSIHVFKILGRRFKLLSILINLFPQYVRDFWYDVIAKYRYKIWGKSDSCILPDESIKHKFIEDI